MAYLTVRLSAGAYQPDGNFTPVSASVKITWDTSESYDQTHGTGTITIGSSSASFSTDFNAGRTESGTQILGGLSASIYHNSNGDPVTVTATASGGGRSASDTITLPGGTPSSGGSSSGDTGGGNEGDSGDVDDGGNTGGDVGGGNTGHLRPMTLKVSILEGEHTTIRAIVIDNADGGPMPGYVLKNGDVLEFAGMPTIQIFYKVDNGYVIDEHTLDGEIFYSGYEWCPTYISSGNIFPVIKTSAIRVEKSCVLIDNGSDFNTYNCYIDNGSGWDVYTPYISVEKHYSWDGLFIAIVNVTDSGLYLRSDKSTSYTNLVLMPNETELTIEDISIGDDGTTVLVKTTYGSKTGWANTKYLDFAIYGRVNNVSGTPFYLDSNLDSNIWYNFEYGQEIVIGGNSDYTELVINNGLIWGNVIVQQGDGTSLGGYVKMQDIDYMSERTELVWHELAYTPDKEPIKYLYKDGIMYSPLLEGMSERGCTVSNTNNILRYSVDYGYRNYKTKAISNAAIDISDFRYLCVKVGQINGEFFIGLNNGGSSVALNNAMCLTSNDSNNSYYVDLSSIDLFGDYYFGFGTEEIGSTASFYIEKIWLSNDIDENIHYKTFDYVLESQGAVG